MSSFFSIPPTKRTSKKRRKKINFSPNKVMWRINFSALKVKVRTEAGKGVFIKIMFIAFMSVIAGIIVLFSILVFWLFFSLVLNLFECEITASIEFLRLTIANDGNDNDDDGDENGFVWSMVKAQSGYLCFGKWSSQKCYYFSLWFCLFDHNFASSSRCSFRHIVNT